MGFEPDYDNNNMSIRREDLSNQKNILSKKNPKFKLVLPIFSSYNFISDSNITKETDENLGFNSQVKKND
jgi:hypothetical protein